MNAETDDKTFCAVGTRFSAHGNLFFALPIKFGDLISLLDLKMLIWKPVPCKISNKYCSECLADAYHSGAPRNLIHEACAMKDEFFDCIDWIRRLPVTDMKRYYGKIWSRKLLTDTHFFVNKANVIWKGIFTPEWAKTPAMGVIRFKPGTRFTNGPDRILLYSYLIMAEEYSALKETIIPITLIATDTSDDDKYELV